MIQSSVVQYRTLILYSSATVSVSVIIILLY